MHLKLTAAHDVSRAWVQVGIAVYNVPLGVTNIPVLCILSMYLLLGLGTDGIFVFVNALARSYKEDAEGPAQQRTTNATERLSELLNERASKGDDGERNSNRQDEQQADAEQKGAEGLEPERLSERVSSRRTQSSAKLRRDDLGSMRGVKFFGRQDPAHDAHLLESILEAEGEAEAARDLAHKRKEHNDMVLKQTEKSWKRWAERAREPMKEEEHPATHGHGRATMLLRNKPKSSVALLGSNGIVLQTPAPAKLPAPRRISSAHALLGRARLDEQRKPAVKSKARWAKRFGEGVGKSNQATTATTSPSNRRSHRDGAEEQADSAAAAGTLLSREAPESSRRKLRSSMLQHGSAPHVQRQTQSKASSEIVVAPPAVLLTGEAHLEAEEALTEKNALEDVTSRLSAGLQMLSHALEPRHSTIMESSSEQLPAPSTPPPSPPGDELGEPLSWIVRCKEVPATPRNLTQLRSLFEAGTIGPDTQLVSMQARPLSTLRDHLPLAPVSDASAVESMSSARLPGMAARDAVITAEHDAHIPESPTRRQVLSGRVVPAQESKTAPTHMSSRRGFNQEAEAKIVARGLSEGSGVLTLTLSTTTVCFAAGIDSPLTIIRQFSLMQTTVMIAYCILSKFCAPLPHGPLRPLPPRCLACPNPWA